MRTLVLLAAACLVRAGSPPGLFENAVAADAVSARKEARCRELNDRAEALLAGDKYPEAAAACRMMIEIAPRAPGARFLLARVLARLGKKDEALSALERAAELGFDDPGSARTDGALAPLRDEARYRKALARISANDEARVERGRPIPGVRTVEGNPEGGLRFRIRMSPSARRENPQRLVIWMHPSGGSRNRTVEGLAPRFIRRGFALLVFTRKDFESWCTLDSERIGRTLDAAAAIDGISDDRPVLLGESAGGVMALAFWRAGAEGLGGVIALEGFFDFEPPGAEAARKVPLLLFIATKGPIRGEPWKQGEAEMRRAGFLLEVRAIDAVHGAWLLGWPEAGQAVEEFLGRRSGEAAPPRLAGAAGWRPPRLDLEALGGRPLEPPAGPRDGNPQDGKAQDANREGSSGPLEHAPQDPRPR